MFNNLPNDFDTNSSELYQLPFFEKVVVGDLTSFTEVDSLQPSSLDYRDFKVSSLLTAGVSLGVPLEAHVSDLKLSDELFNSIVNA